MLIKEAIPLIKDHLEDYLREIGLPTDPKKHFNCISGNNHDSYATMSFYPKHRDGPCIRCYMCGAQYDIFDLVGIYERIDGFMPRLRFLADKYGYVLDDDRHGKALGTSASVSRSFDKKVGDGKLVTEKKGYAPVIVRRDGKDMKLSPKDFLEQSRKTGEFYKTIGYLATRGIDEGLAKKFGFGYEPAYYDYQSKEYWEVLVIPCSEEGGVVRNIGQSGVGNNRYRMVGPKGVWNAGALFEAVKTDCPVVVTEGHFDALSVVSAGGLAVALGGCDSSMLFGQLDEVFRQTSKKPYLVAALDEDEAGIKGSEKLCTVAKEKKFEYTVLPEFYGGCKDLNDHFVKDGARFRELVRRISQPGGVEDYLYDKNGQNSIYLRQLMHDIQGCKTELDKKVSTGFEKLDEILDGGLSYGLHILGAIPAIGKTTFVLQLVDNIAMQDHHILFYSLDMARFELIGKSVSRLTYDICKASGYNLDVAKSASDFLTGSRYKDYSKLEKKVICDAVEKYYKYGNLIYSYDNLPRFTPAEIDKQVAEHIRRKRRKPMVVVDYMQMIKSDPTADDKRNVDNVLVALKDIAMRHMVPVVGISSFNREGYWAKALYSAIKSSGDGEYYANTILALEYPGIGTNNFDLEKARNAFPCKVDLVVLKNKMASCGGRIHFDFYNKFNKFVEIATTGGTKKPDASERKLLKI